MDNVVVHAQTLTVEITEEDERVFIRLDDGHREIKTWDVSQTSKPEDIIPHEVVATTAEVIAKFNNLADEPFMVVHSVRLRCKYGPFELSAFFDCPGQQSMLSMAWYGSQLPDRKMSDKFHRFKSLVADFMLRLNKKTQE